MTDARTLEITTPGEREIVAHAFQAPRRLDAILADRAPVGEPRPQPGRELER